MGTASLPNAVAVLALDESLIDLKEWASQDVAVIEMRYYAEFTFSEIGAVLGISDQKAKLSRFSRLAVRKAQRGGGGPLETLNLRIACKLLQNDSVQSLRVLSTILNFEILFFPSLPTDEISTELCGFNGLNGPRTFPAGIKPFGMSGENSP
jgi:hypothetical protein